jgi:hypothetical protein
MGHQRPDDPRDLFANATVASMRGFRASILPNQPLVRAGLRAAALAAALAPRLATALGYVHPFWSFPCAPLRKKSETGINQLHARSMY